MDRVINAGGIPQKNDVLNQVYANVLNKPVMVPAGIPTSLGSGAGERDGDVAQSG